VIDRRKLARWQVNKEARLTLEGAEACAGCAVKDINLKGAQISLAMKLPTDTFLRLALILTEDCALNLEAWVAWQKTINGHYIYGIYFTRLQDVDKEKIYQFVRRHFPKQLTQKWWRGIEKGGEKMDDQRIFERFSARLPLRFLNLENNQESLAETRDISAKGIGLVAAEQMAVNTPLELWVEASGIGSPFYFRGRVAWSKIAPGQQYWAGVNLDKAEVMTISHILNAETPKK